MRDNTWTRLGAATRECAELLVPSGLAVAALTIALTEMALALLRNG